ncbi:hypothetical protein ASF61_16760 [Duganella sp. Leaf126]|uniref:hypothetical protein n=1 Tax=Duganella sp. Leaf126 TaxID=1736266 RepID=UPI0006F1C592|nr:hypothetical protein [Duganella sp. Leaf126]KQQ31986.1 hypothetical protein ASF61_16760 [Duganella sp. Leaf126]
MSAIVGERDNLIMNTVPRFEPARDKSMSLAATTRVFKVIATGTNTAVPAVAAFTPAMINMDGQVAFTTSDGSALTVAGNTAVLAYVDMRSESVTVTAKITVEGRIYEASETVVKMYDGTIGEDGKPGNSRRVCYSNSSLIALASSPAQIVTEGETSYPPLNAWGSGNAWEGSPQELALGMFRHCSDGIFDLVRGVTVWSAPYLQWFRVGQLSAIAADIGKITAGDIYSAVLHGGPGYAHSTYEWPKNLQGGFHLSALGFLMGNPLTGRYFQVDASGDVYAPGLSIANGSAIFSGNLAAATGTFAGELQAATGTIGLLRSKATGKRAEFDSNGLRAYGPNSDNPMGGLVARVGVW